MAVTRLRVDRDVRATNLANRARAGRPLTSSLAPDAISVQRAAAEAKRDSDEQVRSVTERVDALERGS